MGFWDTLRTAINLAAEVNEMRAEVRGLKAEWTDFLEISLRREERMRKRDQRSLKQIVEEPESPRAAVSADPKAALRQRARERGLLQ